MSLSETSLQSLKNHLDLTMVSYYKANLIEQCNIVQECGLYPEPWLLYLALNQRPYTAKSPTPDEFFVFKVYPQRNNFMDLLYAKMDNKDFSKLRMIIHDKFHLDPTLNHKSLIMIPARYSSGRVEYYPNDLMEKSLLQCYQTINQLRNPSLLTKLKFYKGEWKSFFDGLIDFSKIFPN